MLSIFSKATSSTIKSNYFLHLYYGNSIEFLNLPNLLGEGDLFKYYLFSNVLLVS